MVILHHVGYRFPHLAPDPIGRFFWGIGWAGVDIFFVISGFLITEILLRSAGKHATRAFFLNRFFRIVPLYAVALVTYLLAASIAGTDRDLSAIWWNVFLLTGWAIPFLGVEHVPYTITWSLSVEDSAYLVFATIAGLWRPALRSFLLGAVVVAFALRVLLIGTGTFGPNEVYYFPPTRIDSIALGGLVAFGWIQAGTRVRLVAAACAIAATFLWFFAKGQYNVLVGTIGYSILPVAVAYLCAHLVRSSRPLTATLKPLAHIGQRSYFIYLFHVFVIGALSLPAFRTVCLEIGFWGVSALVLGITLALAEVSWRIFEYPLIRLGRELAERINPPADMRTST